MDTKKALLEMKEKMDKGLYPQWVITDPAIYEMEVEKVFAHSWNFLGHESELKEPNSFITRWIVNDPVLLVKTSEGEIKAFLNSCTHRGVHLCTADYGRKKLFTCPYHGWSFNLDGDLVGIMAGNKLYGEDMKKEDWSLRAIPRVETYQGMIFANLDQEAESLEDYLGDMKWYFYMFLAKSDEGMEVRGVPQRWEAKANWKATYENFTGDPAHVAMTHRSTIELGISRPNRSDRKAFQVVLQNGHGINISYFENPEHPYQNLPESMWPMFKRNLTEEQHYILSRGSIFVGGVFPNLSFIDCNHNGRNYVNFRLWRPKGPDKVEVWCWFMIDKELPEEYKEEAYKGYIRAFGPAGTLEQDDTENWARIVDASKGVMMRDKELRYDNVSNYLMGYKKTESDPTFPGPGEAYPNLVDAVSRSIHEKWFDLMTKGVDIKATLKD